ncbi:MarR family transcriptional regulator [Shewanella yunxiaonensis]|uniref:MarR family transcriptional regulator n=1 Tax=Shewanella yunxiaonensis TaxID=2829809 RepID=A0ABX7YYF8_9GAMM|nr:MarR family transcriptional regulator [Shewanella yunxiaonensis]QUN07091.1 MarR family transcriptional regulator [Shewanella yunxiaonensis]
MKTDPKAYEILLTKAEKHWPEVATPQFAATVALQRVGRLFSENAKNTLAEFNLTTTEFEVVSTLRFSDFPYQMMPSELYPRLLMSSGGLTKVLKSVEDRGLITRPQSEGDQRVKPIQLTEKGILLMEKAMEVVQSRDDLLAWQHFSTEKTKHLCELLKELLDILEKER